MCVNCPKILQELKAEIREEIANKTPAMLVSVITKTRKQLTQWNGGVVTSLI